MASLTVGGLFSDNTEGSGIHSSFCGGGVAFAVKGGVFLPPPMYCRIYYDR